MKRLLILIVATFVATNCYAELWHYTDKVTGEEKGICYSDSPIDNPNWKSEVISEDQKQQYIDLQKEQIDKKPKVKSDTEKRLEALEKKVGIN